MKRNMAKNCIYTAILLMMSFILANITINQRQLSAAETNESEIFSVSEEKNTSDIVQITITPMVKETAAKTLVLVQASSPYGIDEIKYEIGNINTGRYFISNGSIITDTTFFGMFEADENSIYTVYAKDLQGNTAMMVYNFDYIDNEPPEFTLSYDTDEFNKKGKTFVSFSVGDTMSDILSISYQNGVVIEKSDRYWSDATDITNKSGITIYNEGYYSFRATDKLGNATVKTIYIGNQFHAVWIAYSDFSSTGYTYDSFRNEIDTMFDKVVQMNMNAVIVHVRPFSDAMYPSKYYPWSKYCSGKLGQNPGFDPLLYMVDAAHKRGLEIHAWLNPYRITNNSTSIDSLPANHPAKLWKNDGKTGNDRNVLAYDNKLFYNPSSDEVIKLICDGVAEIVENYDVDGIHFDDYFYPDFGNNYRSVFDAKEYDAYAKKAQNSGKAVMSISDWRRNNVNKMVKSVYSTVKNIRQDCVFGISPAGNVDSLNSEISYYVDYQTWIQKKGYIDYICPQLYWSYEHVSCPFETILNKWLEAFQGGSQVKLYIGIAVYRVGETNKTELSWKNDPDVLVKQIEYANKTNQVSGFMYFRYQYFINKSTEPAIKNLLEFIQ